jgi:hypothetical protein
MMERAFGASVWLNAALTPLKLMAITTEQARIAFRYIFYMVERGLFRILWSGNVE